jgi:hypothetical protein
LASWMNRLARGQPYGGSMISQLTTQQRHGQHQLGSAITSMIWQRHQ